MINSLKNGFAQLWQYNKIWIILYFLTVALASFVAYPFKVYIENKVGHSLMVKDMLAGFNYTFYADFMNHYGDGIAPIMNQSVLIIALYLLLFIFLMGGIISTFLHRKIAFNKNIFLGKSAHYFWRILRLSFYFLIIHGIIFRLFIFIFLKITNGLSPTDIESEGIIFVTIKYMVPIYVLFASFFFMWQDYAKISLVKNDAKWMYIPMLDAILFIFKNFKKTFGLYLINLSLLGLVFVINYYITMAFEIRTDSTIFLSFFITQLFIIVRLGLKLVNISSAGFLYHPLEEQQGF